MAEKKSNESLGGVAKAVSPHDMVELTVDIPRSTNEDPNVVIYVNGKNWVVPKDGKSYSVPRYVADEYYRSRRAQGAAMTKKAEMMRREDAINARSAAKIGGSVT